MSRKISEIYNQMIVEKETFSNLSNLSPTGQIDPSQSLLTDLNSTSKVAVWRLIFYVVAVAIWIHESLFDVFEAQVNATSASMIAGTNEWCVNIVKAFQYGDSLSWGKKLISFLNVSNSIDPNNQNAWGYITLDTEKQIVSQCAIISASGILNIKVAKDNGTGGLTVLSAYLTKMLFAGVRFNIINNTADLLQLAYTIYYDPLLIYNNTIDPTDALNGSLISDPTKYPVNDAINNYIKTLNFNGIFYVDKLTDAIQNGIGVSNVIANTVKAKHGAVPYADILAVASQSYQANAGYLAIDPAYPLLTGITYTAQ